MTGFCYLLNHTNNQLFTLINPFLA